MKKLLYLFAALALFACEQPEDFDQPTQGGNASGAGLPEVIYATVDDESDDAETRTVVSGQSVLWNTGDAVSLFLGETHNAKYQYNGEDRKAYAAFELDEENTGVSGSAVSLPLAVYPYSSATSYKSANTVEVNFPTVQTYAENSFGRGANVMVGVGESADDNNLYFRNACGYLVIKLKGEGVTVKSITLTALGGEKIAGKGLITASNDAAPVVAMTDEGSSTITLNCGQGVALGANATEFWFAMPPVTFSEGFKIHVVPTKGLAFEIQTSKQVEITRKDIQPMAALQYTPNTQLPNQVLYTRSDDKKDPVTFYSGGYNGGYNFTQPFDADLTQHYYDESIQKFVMECDDTIKAILQNGLATTRIKTVSLPSQLESIGEFAFYGTHLVEIVIPGSVTVLHKDGFHNCDKLKRVTFLWGEEDLQINDLDGVFMNSNMSDDLQLHESDMDYMYLDRNIRYADENGVVSSANKLKYGLAPNADEVIIGPNVSKIPPMAFNGADATRLVIPGNINYIGAYALRNLYELKELVIEPSPTNTPLTIEYDESYGETGPFYLLNSLYDVLETIQLNREIIYDYQPKNEDQGVFSDRRSLKTVVLGEQVKTISDWMFSEAPMLNSVTIQSALTSIGNYAFYNCDALTSVTFPTSLTSIGNSAFENCDGITSVDVPTSVTTMGNDVFRNSDAIATATLGAQTIGTGVLYDCDALHTVTIKGTVNTIGNDAFYSCGKIKNVTFEASEAAEPTTLTLGYQTYGTGEEGPFYDSNLETVVWKRNISYTLANMGSADQTDEGIFSQNSALTSVTIGDQVKSIPPYTFAASGLSGSVWIPHTVESIGDYAFYDCDNLRGLTLGYDGTTPFPTIGTGVFDGCSNSNIYIKVREGVYNSFIDKATNNQLGWGAYKDKIVTGPY